MKRTYRILLKVVVSGIAGLAFFLASIFLASYAMPASDHPDVVEGWGAGIILILAALFSMLLPGVIATIWCYNDIQSPRDIVAIPFFSGLIAAIFPFIVVAVMGSIIGQLFWLGLIVLLICLTISVAGGLITYTLIKLLEKIMPKRA